MGIIKRLSEGLASKIAAGEVIERPASVLKELMENAIDAGARTVSVELKNGGIDMIQVQDDGDGILSEDVDLAVQRHATSKLHREQDLYEITTLGFRGEALYSIGVISELGITSRHKSEEIGTTVTVRGGNTTGRSAAARAAGTTVTVSNLFFNTPARRKFLGSPQAEYRACLDIIDRFVFGRKDTGIRLVHNTREVLNIQPASLDTRIVLRLDPGLKNKLYETSYDNGIIKVQGFVSDPDYTINTSKLLSLYVNGRYIVDKSMNYTILNAYSTALQKGRYPVAIIHMEIPPHFVDVNVNPTKTAVKFADKTMVHDAVGRAVRDTMNRRHIAYQTPDNASFKAGLVTEIKDAAMTYVEQQHEMRQNATTGGKSPAAGHRSFLHPVTAGSDSPSAASQQELGQKGEFSSLNVYGQFLATYIVAAAPGSIVLVDQHAMHERIIFEELVQNMKTKDRHSQMLLAPQDIFLNEHRLSIVTELREALVKIGYDLTIGSDHVSVGAVPAEIPFSPLFLIELIDHAGQGPIARHIVLDGEQSDDPLYRLIADMACKSAVKAGDFLPGEKITALFSRLDRLAIPLNCPHGRPFVFFLPQAEIEKFFHRR